MSTVPAPAASLHLTTELAENIRSLSFDGLKALPRRGAEVGGWITASTATAGEADDVIVVKCEYLFGPSYHLSVNDFPQLREAAEQCKRDGRTIAAYFRSCTRQNVEVDDDDRCAIAEGCADVSFVVIARPSANGSARIVMFRRGEGDHWTSAREFTVPSPFKSAALRLETIAPADGVKILEKAAPEPLAEPSAVEAPVGPAPAPERMRVSVARPHNARQMVNERWWKSPAALWLLYAGVLFLATYFALELFGRSKAAGNSPAVRPAAAAVVAPNTVAGSGLGLAVRSEGGQLHLTWNRDSRVVAAAASGVLQIYDGGSPSTITLGARDLTEGSLVYAPHSPDVTFRLKIGSDAESSAEEVIRVVGMAPVSRGVKPAKTDARTVAVPAAPYVATAAPVVPVAKPPAPAEKALDNRPVVSDSKANEAASNTPVAPPSGPSPITAEKPAEERNTSPVQAPEVVKPQPAVAASPMPAVSVPPLPPTPLRRVQPVLSGARWNVPETTRIGVLVSINTKGLVSDARIDANAQHKSVFLQGLCLNAAREWTFRPATVNGRAVASTYRIEFVFTAH